MLDRIGYVITGISYVKAIGWILLNSCNDKCEEKL